LIVHLASEGDSETAPSQWSRVGFGEYSKRTGALKLLIGYIDESGSSQSDIFTLSCLIGWDAQWAKLESQWLRIIGEKNRELRAQGRQTISRFHATDWSTSNNEFYGWSHQEGIEFGAKLLDLINQYPLGVCGYSLKIEDLRAVFPECVAQEKEFVLAHVLLFPYIVSYLDEKILSDPTYAGDQLAFIKDDSEYNGVMERQLELLKIDETLSHRSQLTTIKAKTSRTCIALQIADFAAYENYKSVEREPKHKRRITLDKMLSVSNFAGRNVFFPKAALEEIRTKIDAAKLKVMFETAGIR
jgi:hypothetical protein